MKTFKCRHWKSRSSPLGDIPVPQSHLGIGATSISVSETLWLRGLSGAPDVADRSLTGGLDNMKAGQCLYLYRVPLFYCNTVP